jgi:hypothetical protein
MLSARAAVAVAAAGASLLAPAAGAILLPAAGERTYPHVHPRTGGPATAFALSFRLRVTPGHTGLLLMDYRVGVYPLGRMPVRCRPPEPANIETGTAGRVERVALIAPAGGWCDGSYRATVYLERGPYCPPPVYGMPVPCAEFATQELDTGSARFTVR